MANHLKTEKKIAVISMLCEGASIRSVERITGVNQNTIMSLNRRVGEACEQIMHERFQGLNCRNVEVDEIWGFVGKKQKNTKPGDRRKGLGDVWTFIALDADSKLIPSFLVGQRDAYHANCFIEDLANRLSNRVQVSSDGMNAYVEAMERGFGVEVDYGQIVKTFSVVDLRATPTSRYSPAEVVEVEKNIVCGAPIVAKICTSHVEKQNHTLRMHCRRLTRLTNAFSKKLENFKAAVALNFAYYNFVKINKAVRMTPAMAAGVESHIWTVEELVKLCGE